MNIYNDTEHEKTIYQGLISDTEFKKDILNYLTLFHFSRYEATKTRNRPISLKLDPYQNLIGDDSVGKLSILNLIKKDKESMKMIQAGSYAYSFYRFLQSQNLLEEQENLTFNIFGYSDRGISSLSLTNTEEHINILKTCYHIYKPVGNRFLLLEKPLAVNSII